MNNGRVGPRIERRRLIQAGIAGGLVLGVGSVIGVVRARGYEISAARAAKLVTLSPWQFVTMQHLARRICAPDDPRDKSIPSADAVDVAGFVDGFLANVPSAVRSDLVRFLALIEHVAPFRLGHMARFTRLSERDQDGVLTWLEGASSELLRAGFAGLKSLVFMGYYRDPRTWAMLRYEGPLVARPEGGWR